MIELVLECTMHVTLGVTQVVGTGPFGTRMVVPVTGGWVAGERLNGSIAPPGADWLLVGRDGIARLDVREQVHTDDGAVIFLTYEGVLHVNQRVMSALDDPAVETAWADQYFRSTPRFETGAPQYAWLQHTVFVGRGRIALDGVEYELYRVA